MIIFIKKTERITKSLCSRFLELVVRIELTTCSLRMSCSAIEPHQRIFNYECRMQNAELTVGYALY